MSSDAVLADAVDAARAALEDVVEPAVVGEHLRAVPEGEGLLTHLFVCAQPGYRGWTWAVSLSRAPEDEAPVTVNDVVLLPGDDAVVAPPWTPYRERIQPGDLSPGDLLPPEEDDARLVPAWSAGDHLETLDLYFAREVGLGREWVLSLEGRDLAAQRWQDGDQGPEAPLAKQAPGRCDSCGFLVSLAGQLSDRFGVCANGSANDDGRVVALDHGCGAHSGARLSRSAGPQKLPPPALDTVTVDDVDDL